MARVLFFILFITFGFGFTVSENSVDGEVVYLQDEVLVSPNPAVSITKVISRNATLKINKVKVYSIVNEEVISQSNRFPSNSMELNVMKLPNGKYFVKVYLSDGSEKLVILVKTS